MIARFRHGHSGVRRGITLIEVVVLCVIVVLLILIMLPAIQTARETARKVHCVENLQQLARATHLYVSANGVFPPGARDPYDPPGQDRRGIESWLLLIMQYSEYKYAYDSCNFSFSVLSSVNSTVSGIGIPLLWCPSDPTVASRHVIPHGTLEGTDLPMHHTSYGGNAGPYFLDAPAKVCRETMPGIVFLGVPSN
jgi:type II secretory pathway pseudopilin PulG